MARADEGLAFLLKYENVAWYENGTVRILDRRCYPNPVSFVTCKTAEDVAKAITGMVTQSAGPYLAAGMGMVLAAHECENFTPEAQLHYLNVMGDIISKSRVTTSKRMKNITESCIETAKKAFESGCGNAVRAIFDHVIEITDYRYRKMEQTAKYLVDKFPDEGTVMTQCFAETILGFMCKECRARGKKIKFICPETRPFFQGSRLTASVISDMGFDVTVITDNMPAWTMHEKKVDVFTCAADAITMDGWVVNKVGTLQIALAAKYWNIPVYVTGAPDRYYEHADDVKVEERNPAAVLSALGSPTCKEGLNGYYPSFDKTPPELVTGIVTYKGIYDPHDLSSFAGDRLIPGAVIV